MALIDPPRHRPARQRAFARALDKPSFCPNTHPLPSFGLRVSSCKLRVSWTQAPDCARPMAIPTSTSSASVFSPNARDPNATLRKTRPPPLDAATITRTNSGWTRASPSSSLGLDLGPVDDLTAADSDRARRQAAGTVDQFRGLGSGGLLGSFQHVGHWGETVTRSLLDAVSSSRIRWAGYRLVDVTLS